MAPPPAAAAAPVDAVAAVSAAVQEKGEDARHPVEAVGKPAAPTTAVVSASEARRGEDRFVLGEQPIWAGEEPVLEVEDGAAWVAALMAESPVQQLRSRGYCVVPMPRRARRLYDAFHSGFEAFCSRPLEERMRFAQLQFHPAQHSPNQLHGYSEVSGLKCQFMMRAQGALPPESERELLPMPPELMPCGSHLYAELDALCRRLERATMRSLGRDPAYVDAVLDPVHVDVRADDADEEEEEEDFDAARPLRGDATPLGADEPLPVDVSDYVPPGYISSSIMDNFHYFNLFDDGERGGGGAAAAAAASTAAAEAAADAAHQLEKRYKNNHAAHTDSGLMTVVVATDAPGLEIFDQKLQEWVAVERHLHEAAAAAAAVAADGGDPDAMPHRNYAICFWSDSVVYLTRRKDVRHAAFPGSSSQPDLRSCFHRVADAGGVRYSVVFKQRTCPVLSAPRYQEDFELAALQLAVLDARAQRDGPQLQARLPEHLRDELPASVAEQEAAARAVLVARRRRGVLAAGALIAAAAALVSLWRRRR